MKRASVSFLFASALMCVPGNAQPKLPQSGVDSNQAVLITAAPTVVAASSNAVQGIEQQAGKVAMPMEKDVLGQMSSMFEAFAKYIGILLTIVTGGIGLGAGILGFFAFKSFREFKKEGKKQLEDADKNLQRQWEVFLVKATAQREEVLAQARQLVADADKSARECARFQSEAESTRAVLERTLADLEKQRAALPGLQASAAIAPNDPASNPAVPLPEPAAKPEISDEELAKMTADLKGKLGETPLPEA